MNDHIEIVSIDKNKYRREKKRVDLVDGINLTVYAWLEIVNFKHCFGAKRFKLDCFFFSFASFRTYIQFYYDYTTEWIQTVVIEQHFVILVFVSSFFPFGNNFCHFKEYKQKKNNHCPKIGVNRRFSKLNALKIACICHTCQTY